MAELKEKKSNLATFSNMLYEAIFSELFWLINTRSSHQVLLLSRVTWTALTKFLAT